jgi:hypothetical protein
LNTTVINPVLTAVVVAIRLEHREDAALLRSLDRALDDLHNGAVYEFDGDELRVVSTTRRNDGVIHVVTSSSCTCEGRARPWCRHRALFLILFTYAALRSPVTLRASLVEQMMPVGFDSPDLAEVLPPPWLLECGHAEGDCCGCMVDTIEVYYADGGELYL